ncbi:hypothetical protein Tco_0563900 [Tanacetum coccineum]
MAATAANTPCCGAAVCDDDEVHGDGDDDDVMMMVAVVRRCDGSSVGVGGCGGVGVMVWQRGEVVMVLMVVAAVAAGGGKRRVTASGGGDRVDPVVGIVFDYNRKSPPKKFSGGGGGSGRKYGTSVPNSSSETGSKTTQKYRPRVQDRVDGLGEVKDIGEKELFYKGWFGFEGGMGMGKLSKV